MPDKQTVAWLRYVHGSYNILIAALFFYQGKLGLKIRRQKKEGTSFPVNAIKRHRKIGHFLSILGGFGFFSGLILVYIDHGHIFKYPFHFFTGSAIALSLLSTYLVSRKIRLQSSWRTPHSIIGILIIFFYILQLLLGLGILL